jgi:predicted acyltransferase
MEDGKRLMGLDVMRGITMAVMLIVDATGEAYPTIGHAPWNGLHLADFVMPYFLFISGISASISVKIRPRQLARSIFLRVLFRVLRLFALGIAVQGSIFHVTEGGPLLLLNLSTVRIMGILQRIAIVFLIVIAIELFIPARRTDLTGALLYEEQQGIGLWIIWRTALRWASALAVVLAGELLGSLSPPSSWPGCAQTLYSSDPSRADAQQLHEMGCSSVGWLDSLLLGVNHLYITGNNQGPEVDASFGFDPEGLVTTLNAVFPMFVGLHVGRAALLLDMKNLFVHWTLLGTFFSVLGFWMTTWIAFNKRLWSPSYSLFTTGTGILMYALLFLLCDHNLPVSRSALSASFGKVGRFLSNILRPFQWLGSNCILFFVFSECCGVLSWFLQTITWGAQQNAKQNLVSWFHDKFLWHSCGLGKSCTSQSPCGPVEVAFTAVGLLFWILVCGLLHRKGIFWKI